MDRIDTLSHTALPAYQIVKTAELPLPSDNWYDGCLNPEELERLSAWGSCPRSTFALFDDGDGLRWFPVLPQWKITNTDTGEVLGIYDGEDEGEALDHLAQAAGYRDHAHACEVTGEDDSALLVEAL
jgi:hypothetical protein